MIYTSNYARKGADENAFGISIAVPNWFDGRRLSQLAPTWELVCGIQQGDIDNDTYRRKYIELLESRRSNKLNLDYLLSSLPSPSYLLCYEAPGEFCHRRVFAEWVEEKCGLVIPEWKNPKEEEETKQREVVDNLFDF